MSTPSPDEINAKPGGPFYSCFGCGATTGLHWYRGTSCPICSRPECQAACDREWERAYEEIERRDDDW